MMNESKTLTQFLTHGVNALCGLATFLLPDGCELIVRSELLIVLAHKQ